jgi:hypothetical protein
MLDGDEMTASGPDYLTHRERAKYTVGWMSPRGLPGSFVPREKSLAPVHTDRVCGN